jgi:hypothetical protein
MDAGVLDELEQIVGAHGVGRPRVDRARRSLARSHAARTPGLRRRAEGDNPGDRGGDTDTHGCKMAGARSFH